MKKLTLLICVLAMLPGLAGGASADAPIRDTIKVSGWLTAEPTVTPIGPNRILIEDMQAKGTVTSSNLFKGADFFIDDEDAIINLRALRGRNWGQITIDTVAGKVHIEFHGQTFDLDEITLSGSVAGQFRVVGATGDFEGLRGQGRYSGTAAFLFTLTFTGQFHIEE